MAKIQSKVPAQRAPVCVHSQGNALTTLDLGFLPRMLRLMLSASWRCWET